MMVLASAGLITLSIPFARLFGGAADDVSAMALVMSAYAVGLVAFSLVFVIQRVYYSLGDTRTPFMFQLVHTTVFIALALVVSGFSTDQIASSLALSASIASWLQLVLALVLLRKKLGGLRLHTLVGRLLLFTIAAVLASAAGVALVNALGGGDPDGFVMSAAIGPLVALASGAIVMSLVYFGVLRLIRNDDAAAILDGGIRLLRKVFTR